ncbi:hypothetical protein HOY80DRAFT_953362, partial [Tuber brumale]
LAMNLSTHSTTCAICQISKTDPLVHLLVELRRVGICGRNLGAISSLFTHCFFITRNLDYSPSTVRFSCFLIISSLLFFFFFASLTLHGCPLCLFLLNYSFVVIVYNTFQCFHASTYPPCLALFPILFL